MRAVHVDVLVVGGGIAGLAAAAEAADRAARACSSRKTRSDGGASGPACARRIDALGAEARAAGATILERHTAVGIYDGPFVPVVGPDELLQVEAGRVIVATGAVETHGVFPGNDLPGVWLGRGAARMAGVHGVAPGRRAVVVDVDRGGPPPRPRSLARGRHRGSRSSSGTPSSRAPRGAAGSRRVIDRVRRGPAHASPATRWCCPSGGRRATACSGWAPRTIVGAGDVVLPGCTIEEAEAQRTPGGAAASARPTPPRPTSPWATDGYVCLCEDVRVHDLEQAWGEGWRSSEILKRYTTATMGPCQGALCGRHLAAFAAARAGAPTPHGRTHDRAPARAARRGSRIWRAAWTR